MPRRLARTSTLYAFAKLVPLLPKAIDTALCADRRSLGLDVDPFLATVNEMANAWWPHVAAALVTRWPQTFRMENATAGSLRHAARAADEPSGWHGRARDAADRAALRMMTGTAGADFFVVLSNIARTAGMSSLSQVLLVAGTQLYGLTSVLRAKLTGETGRRSSDPPLDDVVVRWPSGLLGRSSDTSGSE